MDHLLRTLAAIPPGCRILDLGCGTGLRAEPLARLGFDLHACDPDTGAVVHTRRRLAPLLPDDDPARRITLLKHLHALDYEDASFDWVVAGDLLAHARREGVLPTLLQEIRRVLKPGGWLYADVPAAGTDPAGDALPDASDPAFTPASLEAAMAAADLAVAETRTLVDTLPPRIQAIYRRVDPDTPR